jgi:uncharacterized protein (TIGR02996 family)
MASARHPELEAAILADLDDEQARLVYADWLQLQGDPRGELAAAQAAGDQARAEAIIEAHHDELLGGLNERVGKQRQRQLVVTWRLGWLERVRLVDRAFGLTRPYTRLASLASARFLRDLSIEVGNDERLRTVVADHGVPWPLERFEVTTMTVNLGALGDLWARLPRVRELSLAAMSFELGRIELPRLRRARLACQAMTSDNLLAISGAHWPELRRLEISFLPGSRWGTVGRTADPALLRELFLRRDLPELDELAITGCSTIDEVVPELLGSPLLARLRRLDLSGGHLSDDGAGIFLRHAAAFAHLESLDLRSNLLGPAVMERLRDRHPGIRLVPQYGDQPYQDEDDGA